MLDEITSSIELAGVDDYIGRKARGINQQPMVTKFDVSVSVVYSISAELE
jgi:hypothetical protein